MCYSYINTHIFDFELIIDVVQLTLLLSGLQLLLCWNSSHVCLRKPSRSRLDSKPCMMTKRNSTSLLADRQGMFRTSTMQIMRSYVHCVSYIDTLEVHPDIIGDALAPLIIHIITDVCILIKHSPQTDITQTIGRAKRNKFKQQ